MADLLHHTSGISEVYDIRSYAGFSGNAGFGIAELLSFAARQRILEFETGSMWSYSNTGYALLAKIVARVTGRPFGESMRDNVFEPLDMHDSSFPLDGRQVLPNRANAYSPGSDGTLKRSLVEEFSIPDRRRPSRPSTTWADGPTISVPEKWAA